MFEKSKKSKDVEELDDFQEEEFEEVKTEDKKAKSAKSDGIMAKANAMAASSSTKKRGVDPILAVSAIVLMLACVVVIGNTVYSNTIADHTEPKVEFGDNIEVDYIGCYYAFYDADKPHNGAVIFDTSISTLNSEVPTSYEYNPGFNTLTFEVGKSTSLLKKFQNAVIGLRPGETTTVMIPAADAYGALSPSEKHELLDSYTISMTYTYATADAFKEAFGIDAPANGSGAMPVPAMTTYSEDVKSSPYGFGASVITNPNGSVTVTYLVDESETYYMNKYIEIDVEEISGDSITFSYNVMSAQAHDDDVRMLKAYIDDATVYLELNHLGNVMYYKTTDEKTGEDLYFTITVLRYVEKSS